MSFSYIADFITVMYEEKLEDELFDIWKSNPLKEQSFIEWKEQMLQEVAFKNQQNEANALEAMKKALHALGGEANGS